jgi:hypothetical protein
VQYSGNKSVETFKPIYKKCEMSKNSATECTARKCLYFAVLCVVVVVVVVLSKSRIIGDDVVNIPSTCTNRTGILINGERGTQLFDPDCVGNYTVGNMQLGLATGTNARYGAAVLSGRLAIINICTHIADNMTIVQFNTVTNRTTPLTSLSLYRGWSNDRPCFHFLITANDHESNQLISNQWQSVE